MVRVVLVAMCTFLCSANAVPTCPALENIPEQFEAFVAEKPLKIYLIDSSWGFEVRYTKSLRIGHVYATTPGQFATRMTDLMREVLIREYCSRD